MNMTAQPIVDLLTEAERKRDAALDRADRAKHEAEKYTAEADAYRRALAAIGFGESKPTNSGSSTDSGAKHQRKQRLPSRKWIDIYTALYMAAEEPYDYQSILDAAELSQHKISEGSMRTQMMNAVNGGLFERVDAGKFKFTEYGLKAIDAGSKGNEPPAGGSDANAEGVDDTSGALDLQPKPDQAHEKGETHVASRFES